MCTDILLCILWVLCYYCPHSPPHSQVVSDGNVSLGDDKIYKLVVLRMNREFMKFGRQYYAHRLSEPFGKLGTVLTVESNVEMGVTGIRSHCSEGGKGWGLISSLFSSKKMLIFERLEHLVIF